MFVSTGCFGEVSFVYLLFVCDVGSVGWVHADRNTWRDRCTGQEVRILVISVLNLNRHNSGCVEFLHCVCFLFHIIKQNIQKKVFYHKIVISYFLCVCSTRFFT